MSRPQRIIMVSDGASFAAILAALERRGFDVTVTRDLNSAYPELLESSFDLVLVDVAEGAAGIDFIKRVRAVPELKKTVILAIAEWGTGQATVALSQGADAYEPFPLDAPSLVATVERMLLNSKAVAQ